MSLQTKYNLLIYAVPAETEGWSRRGIAAVMPLLKTQAVICTYVHQPLKIRRVDVCGFAHIYPPLLCLLA